MFGPVPSDEMAFAMTLFVSAVHGQISAGSKPLTPTSMQEAERLFLSLATTTLEDKKSEEVEAALGTPLFRAYMVVWNHYRNDGTEKSISARLLGFYYLMARSRGTALDRWTEPASSDQAVLLHPAVVETLAGVALQSDGRLDPELFLEELGTLELGASQPSPRVISAWPVRGGMMATLIREHDWSQTSIGRIASWPQNLRTNVDLILACKFPMVVLWGEELIQIYNDGYCDLMGKKHPRGLGQLTRDCWPEVWHINKPIYKRVLQGETLTFEDSLYPITRHGYLEDAYFTLCYSPLSDESGLIQGILVTIFETTERVSAELARSGEVDTLGLRRHGNGTV